MVFCRSSWIHSFRGTKPVRAMLVFHGFVWILGKVYDILQILLYTVNFVSILLWHSMCLGFLGISDSKFLWIRVRQEKQKKLLAAAGRSCQLQRDVETMVPKMNGQSILRRTKATSHQKSWKKLELSHPKKRWNNNMIYSICWPFKSGLGKEQSQSKTVCISKEAKKTPIRLQNKTINQSTSSKTWLLFHMFQQTWYINRPSFSFVVSLRRSTTAAWPWWPWRPSWRRTAPRDSPLWSSSPPATCDLENHGKTTGKRRLRWGGKNELVKQQQEQEMMSYLLVVLRCFEL